MTRIYTNVPAMIARNNLGKNMNTLQTALERLSTGFKINSGKDDPAGLIASELLRSDITGIKMAVRNTERANMMIATADSALNEVTNLLNDIRGLVTEAASTGTMSAEMIAANQLQVDASLDAIDRIAAQTTFMGQKLLDGSLGFNVVGIDRNSLKGLDVNQVIFGQNKTPAEVTINVRQAAEKAELYYNQPALAEAIILRWGGNYGYDMETFEKGATVAEIANIINKRSDGTGVIAEVGSDAIAGLLYVSSLGVDNDMLIRAGMGGLNEGNVEIKYLKGGSDGISIKYEEPSQFGAPAKILVYLQTEAYEAAFADDVDNTWVMQNGKLVPLRDNNALQFTANIEGAQYNENNIYYVDGAMTDPNFYTNLNPTGTAGMPYAYYSDAGASSTALFGNTPVNEDLAKSLGIDVALGVNGTAQAFDLAQGEYFAIQARASGSKYNNTTIQFVAALAGDSILTGRRAAAVYTEQKDAYGNTIEGGKTLTVYFNNDGNTTLQDVQEALRLERHLNDDGTLALGEFEIKASIGSKSLNEIDLFGLSAGMSVKSNTHNSGGAAGSLFIVVPPDGKMPPRPDVPELPGVTAKAIGDGLFLAHKGSAWDNYTFEFTQNKTAPGNSVLVGYDPGRNTITITAAGAATYDDILEAINGNWAGKPGALIGYDLYWSDASGVSRTPGVPRALTPTATSGVVGRSAQPVTSIEGVDLYLHHDATDLDDWTVEFVYHSDNTGKYLTTLGDPATRKIVVTYNQNTTYAEILDAINADNGYPTWAGKPSAGKFSWVDADGNAFGGATTAVNSTTAVGVYMGSGSGTGNPLYLQHNDPLWNSYTIQIQNTHTGVGLDAIRVQRAGQTITLSYNPGALPAITYQDILTALNGNKPMAGMGSLSWDAGGPGTVTLTDTFNLTTGGVTLGASTASGTDIFAAGTLRITPTGRITAKTNVPVGDGFYLAHDNPAWDALTFNFSSTGQSGGSVKVTINGGIVDILVDNDTTYDTILTALNDTNSWVFDPPITHSDAAATFTFGGIEFTIEAPASSGVAGNIAIKFVAGGSAPVWDADGTTLLIGVDDPAVAAALASGTPAADFAVWLQGQINAAPGGLTGYTVTDAAGTWSSTVNADALKDKIVNVWWTDTPPPGGLWWVNSSGSKVTPGVPTSLIASTTSGVYRPFSYSPDGRSTLVGNVMVAGVSQGVYLQHTDKSWDNLDFKFTTLPNIDEKDIQITFDGKTISVVLGTAVTYDELLYALNNPLGYPVPDPAYTTVPPDPTDPTYWLPTGGRWTRPGGAPILTGLPMPGDLRWVDIHGLTSTVTTLHPSVTSLADGTPPATGDAALLSISHNDPIWDDYTINFVEDSTLTGVNVSNVGKILNVSIGNGASYQDILDALNGPWTGRPTGALGLLTWDWDAPANPSFDPNDPVGTGELDFVTVVLGKVSYSITNTAGDSIAPSPPLNSVVSAGAVWRDITANDIVALFDLDNPLSRGSERAAGLFTVTTTVDNDGTGRIRLYNYWTDIQGNVVDAGDPTATTYVYAKTAFENIFKGGVTGGSVVTTAAELVTALNNSAYWGISMCPELIAELARENALGNYYDSSNPPVITAQLAPDNHGLFAVTPFEEVAYYGNPNEATALQFLGGLNSPNIRFVVDGPNSDLRVDRTTVPAVVSQAQAVLTAQDSGASLTITAVGKGASGKEGAYDDVQFVFKRVGEDAQGVLSPDRKDGWVEYDPGSSYAYAQATFTDAVTNQAVANTAFFITATERSDLYNNVDVVMRLDETMSGTDPITVTFDAKTNQLRIIVDSVKAQTITTNEIIDAINRSVAPFQAELSYAEDSLNNGTGQLNTIGLSSARFTSIANTKETGGHKGGTVTVWLADANPGVGGPAEGDIYRNPTQEDIVRLINSDPTVSKLFTARAYNSVQSTDTKLVDFVKDGPIVTSGGLVEPAVITVHLGTDKAGNVTTTAADLVKWWATLDPKLVDEISVSIVRPPGAVWDECNDPYGQGFLSPTVSRSGECNEWVIEDIMFVGWDDNADQQHYVAKHSTGIMTSQRGIDSSYQLIAKNLGPEWDGFTIEYIQDQTLTGRFADNMVDGSAVNPCDDPYYSGLARDASGNVITPNSSSERGLALEYDQDAKKITIRVNFGVTTANDIQQLINSDPRTRNRFQVLQLGNGNGFIHQDDNTLVTKGGAQPAGMLNGAKLLFGSDATAYYMVLKSRDYGTEQFVDVLAYATDGGDTTFSVSDKTGAKVEKAYGKDVDAVINGMKASSRGLLVSLNTSALSLDFAFSEAAGTMDGYETSFMVTGGGATFQVGPDVVSRQQITMGIRSINTVLLGGTSGVLNQLRSGHDAELDARLGGDPNKAFRIVDEALVAITSIRGRLGTMQKATLETNITVLNDTLAALTEAESQIRDTDFAEETSNLTRAQILVQANMNTLGIANQIPNYMLSLLGR